MTEALRMLVDTQERIITGEEQMVATLRSIESTLNEHTGILNEHTGILNVHTEILTGHGRLLGSVVTNPAGPLQQAGGDRVVSVEPVRRTGTWVPACAGMTVGDPLLTLEL